MTHPISLSATPRPHSRRTISPLSALLLAVAGNVLVIVILTIAAVMLAGAVLVVFGPALMSLV